jgi:hypothetical protein
LGFLPGPLKIVFYSIFSWPSETILNLLVFFLENICYIYLLQFDLSIKYDTWNVWYELSGILYQILYILLFLSWKTDVPNSVLTFIAKSVAQFCGVREKVTKHHFPGGKTALDAVMYLVQYFIMSLAFIRSL